MSSVRQTQTNFTAGEVARSLLGRGDLRAYENGALTLRNVIIQPTGGVTRRAGMTHVAVARGAGRLVPFEFNTEQTYLLAFADGKLDVFMDDALAASLDAPWTEDQLPQITWTQSADTLLVCHPDVAPQKITRTSHTSWQVEPWEYAVADDVIAQPHYKFAAAATTLTPSATTGTITVTASVGHFVAGHVGVRLRIANKEVLVTEVLSPTVATCVVKQTLASTSAVTDWQEQAFSAVRGWPISVAFHQDRLVIGGARDLPNRLWMSRSGDIWNFDLGTGLDDESIEFAILSDQVNAIRAVFSGRHLQVFTSGAEWMVTGTPLTPASVQITRQTRIGSLSARFIPPVNVDGATLFVSRNGREIREFIYTDVEQAYQANDLSLLARHMIDGPVDMAFDGRRRLLMLVRADGKIAALTVYRSEQVTAWSRLETEGLVMAVAAVGDDIYALVNRVGAWSIERFDDTVALDAALSGTSEEPKATWSGLSHLEGWRVAVVADGAVHESILVEDGEITLPEAVQTVMAGIPFTHVVEPLPPNIISEAGGGKAMRVVEITFRVEDTAALAADAGQGLMDIPLRRLAGNVLDTPPASVTADISVKALGWRRDLTTPCWRIEQDAPLPFTLLCATTQYKVNI